MKPAWLRYWQECAKSARSVVLALGVSLILWASSIPQTPKSELWAGFLVAVVYGLTVFASIWTAFSLTYAFLTYRHLKTGRPFQKLSWGPNVALSLFAMSLGILLAKWFESLIMGQPVSTSNLLESVLVGSFICFMFLFYFAYKRSSEENLALKAAHAESELHVLKNQMQPHFLFNSLNSLSELIETNKDSAADMAMKLADLYREILENSKRPLATLHSEVSIIEKYLELEQIRFGPRLRFDIKVPEDSHQIYLPSLVLQTLVENAVKHGIAPSVEGGTVNVRVSPSENPGYFVCVGNSAGAGSVRGTKTGLENTRARLDLLYGGRHGFALKDRGPQVEASFWFSGGLVGL